VYSPLAIGADIRAAPQYVIAGTDDGGNCERLAGLYVFLGLLILLQERKLAVERSEVIVCLHDGHRPKRPCCCAVEHIVIISVIIGLSGVTMRDEHPEREWTAHNMTFYLRR
jgi:hypothetical protein